MQIGSVFMCACLFDAILYENALELITAAILGAGVRGGGGCVARRDGKEVLPAEGGNKERRTEPLAPRSPPAPAEIHATSLPPLTQMR